MEQRMSLVTLAAQDLPGMTSFYERLGWTAGFRNEAVTFFQLNGVIFGLYKREEFAREVGADPATMGPGGMAIAQNVRMREEVDATLAAAREAGARIVHPARDMPWGGRSGYFADPEGFLWEVAWNPAWTIASDGDVSMAG